MGVATFDWFMRCSKPMTTHTLDSSNMTALSNFFKIIYVDNPERCVLHLITNSKSYVCN